MKSRNAEITVTSIYRADGADAEPSVFSYRGICREVNGGTHILYDEYDEDGHSIRTHVVLREQNIKIHRSGAVEADFLYEPGVLTGAVYRTSFGAIPIEIFTKEYDAVWEDGAVSATFLYDIIQSSAVVARNEVRIECRYRQA